MWTMNIMELNLDCGKGVGKQLTISNWSNSFCSSKLETPKHILDSLRHAWVKLGSDGLEVELGGF